MGNLDIIKAVPKSGDEKVTCNGKDTGFSLLDFWRWSVSDILSNATRGRFAEFLVGTAVGIDFNILREEWDAYDLITPEGIKVEVKSAAYIQSWRQNRYSKISFSIRAAKFWSSESENQRSEAKRHADVYVFCLLKHLEQETINPLFTEQWEFYIVPTSTLDTLNCTGSIGINRLRTIAEAVSYTALKNEIKKAFLQQKDQLK